MLSRFRRAFSKFYGALLVSMLVSACPPSGGTESSSSPCASRTGQAGGEFSKIPHDTGNLSPCFLTLRLAGNSGYAIFKPSLFGLFLRSGTNVLSLFFFFFLFSLTFWLANIPHPAPCRSLSGVTWSCAECAAGLGCQRGAGPGPAVPTAGSSPTPELSLGGGGGFGSSGAGSTRWEGGLSSLVSHFSYSSSLMCLLPSCPQFAPVSPPVSPCPPLPEAAGGGVPAPGLARGTLSQGPSRPALWCCQAPRCHRVSAVCGSAPRASTLPGADPTEGRLHRPAAARAKPRRLRGSQGPARVLAASPVPLPPAGH